MSKPVDPDMVSHPTIKPFPWKCGHCRERAVQPDELEYTADAEYEGRTYTVTVPRLKVPRCRKCGEMVLDTAADRQITEALRQQLGLLAPEQIRENRQALGLTQRQLASKLGIAEATLSRWETGGQIQQRVLDRMLRLYFGLGGVRAALDNEKGLAGLGTAIDRQPASESGTGSGSEGETAAESAVSQLARALEALPHRKRGSAVQAIQHLMELMR